ncbi:TlpA family protein disulfide reductase [Lentibacter sp. XHP0401]|uniref:TlpA family protein disulfide reductase n=1 Tax=Lentibacter sp. XHP0401 TaxID=2984334 RepID=UPI0021E6FAC1|nr:TlpA disulfide reductase family protein [Lentibacter sp. XHP0401]MCV2894122.1 TlpA family protein disulfide reductase [Lentibacter sp. XHP0401]
MKMSRSKLVYTALAAIAIIAGLFAFAPSTSVTGGLSEATRAEVQALQTGDMKKLVLYPAPQAVATAPYTKPEGGTATLAEHKGKIVLLNFWATWCAPCRKEMPLLAELQTELGGEDFEVVTIATGKNDPAAMARFFSEIGVTNLPLHADPKSAVAREMGVLGLPATIIITRDGTEVARLLGDADWASDSAKNILKALIAAND